MRRLAIGLAMGALALAACSKPAPVADASTASANVAAASPAATMPAVAPVAVAPVAAAPVAAAPAGAVTLAQLPAPTAGSWRRVGSQDGAAPVTSTKCLDGKPLNPMDGLPFKCARMDLTRTASGGFTMDADCPRNGIDAKLRMSAEGDFAKAFTTDATMVMTGGPGPALDTKNHSVWTYIGPTCAKG